MEAAILQRSDRTSSNLRRVVRSADNSLIHVYDSYSFTWFDWKPLCVSLFNEVNVSD